MFLLKAGWWKADRVNKGIFTKSIKSFWPVLDTKTCSYNYAKFTLVSLCTLSGEKLYEIKDTFDFDADCVYSVA